MRRSRQVSFQLDRKKYQKMRRSRQGPLKDAQGCSRQNPRVHKVAQGDPRGRSRQNHCFYYTWAPQGKTSSSLKTKPLFLLYVLRFALDLLCIFWNFKPMKNSENYRVNDFHCISLCFKWFWVVWAALADPRVSSGVNIHWFSLYFLVV